MVQQIHADARRILGHNLTRVVTANDISIFGFDPREDAAFDPDTSVIYVALQGSQNPRSTARHEMMHALRQSGVFTRPEWATLARMAQLRWIGQFDIRARYEKLYSERFDLPRDQIEELLAEEAVAEVFAEYWATRAGPGSNIAARMFDKVVRFLEAVANLLRGHGFTSASQILENAETGRMARRDSGYGDARGFQLLARQSSAEQQEALSARPRIPPPRNPGPDAFDAPHDERVYRALSDSTSTILNRIRRAGSAIVIEARRKVQDREIDLLRTQSAITAAGLPIPEPQDAYLAASLYPGRVAQRDKDLIEDDIKPLIEDIARRGLTLQEVDDFTRARHAFERNIEVGRKYRPGEQFHDAMTNPAITGGSGLSGNQAGDILTVFQNSGKYADLESAGDRIVAGPRHALLSLRGAPNCASEGQNRFPRSRDHDPQDRIGLRGPSGHEHG